MNLYKYYTSGDYKDGTKYSEVWFRINTVKNSLQNTLKFNSFPGAYHTIYVNPSEIHNKNRQPNHPRYGGGLGQIKEGDWDVKEHCTDVENYHVIEAFMDYFNRQLTDDWKETAFREYWKQNYAGTEHKYADWTTYTVERITPYVGLYREIKENGYKENTTTGSIGPGRIQPVRNQLEVLVSITRTGDIYFFSGHHRFAIARALEITIPVHVIRRHTKWQEIREEISEHGLTQEYEHLENHPDIINILDE